MREEPLLQSALPGQALDGVFIEDFMRGRAMAWAGWRNRHILTDAINLHNREVDGSLWTDEERS